MRWFRNRSLIIQAAEHQNPQATGISRLMSPLTSKLNVNIKLDLKTFYADYLSVALNKF